MKPLKDIGFRVTPNEHSVTQYEPYTTFTDEERREFARRIYIEGYAAGYRDGDDDFEGAKNADEFIKEQGL